MTTVTAPSRVTAPADPATAPADPATPTSGSLLEVSTASTRRPWSRRGALFLLKAYQGAASGRVSTCRYYPSCSNYAVEAFSVHGFWRAFGLTARRLLRCRPFGPHGIDLVPLPDGAAHAHDCGQAPEHVARAGPLSDTNEVADTNEAAQATQATQAAQATQATEVRQPC
jgi:uncharacterized protein